MNKLFTLTLIIATTFVSVAQVKVPPLSPSAEVEQIIGLTEVEVEYSRPSKRGRKIFGELVPYGKIWRTGANKNTTIEFSTDVEIKDVAIEKGEYAVFSKVGKESWTIILYKDTDNWGVPEELEKEKIEASFDLKVLETKHAIETFTIQFENLTTKSADLTFSWDKVKLVLPMTFPTEMLTEISIKKTLASDSISERDYYGAASYFLSSKKNLKDALSFIDKAIEMRGKEAFWYIRKKALIQYELGMKKEAIKTAKMSLESAKSAGNNDYVKMNEESIKEWSSEK